LAGTPLYQPGVPLYENFARVLFGLNSMPTLEQRVGNRYWNGDAVTAPTANGAPAERQMFWARTEGMHTSIGSGTTTGSAYKSDQFKMQTGLDALFLENGNGRLIGGFNFQYGTATAHINSAFGNGRINTMAYSVGGTLTWYGDNGFYVDGQGQATLFNSDLKSDLVARDMVGDNDSMGYGLSAEIGQRIGVGNGWTVTPQAQLVYSAVDFDFTDSFGTPVSLSGGDSLNSRLGLSLDHQQSWRDENGKLARMSTYGIANMYYEFLDGPEADVAGTMFASDEARLQGGLGLGGTYSWNDGKYAVHGEAMVRGTFDNDYSVGGTGGFSMKW
jgi:fibronectin-binding autotransporter adhesin